MRARPVLLALGAILALGGLALFAVPSPLEDLRSPALVSGLFLLALGAAAGDRVPSGPLSAPRALLLASLLVSLFVAARDGVAFLRQARTQAGMTLSQRRDVALQELKGLRGQELAEAERAIPEDAAVVVLFNSARNRHAAELLAYYLRPRRLHFWREGGFLQLVDGRAVALPDEAWLQRRGIRWALLLGGHQGDRVRALRLEEVPRL